MTRLTQTLHVAAGGALLLALGCQSPQQEAREAALRRWNHARAEVKVKLAADQLEAGDVDAAAGELAEADRLDPDNPNHVVLEARVCLAKGQLNAAERILESAQLEGNNQAEAEYLLGLVRQQQQRWEDALAAFLHATELNPDELEYVVAAVQTWLQLGEAQVALEFLEKRTTQFAWMTAYQSARAECQEQLGNWSAAASTWQRIVDGGEDDEVLRQRLAVALFHAQRYVEAVPVLQDLLQNQPEVMGGWLRLMLAESYLAEGRLTAARDEVRTLLRTDPDHPAALRLLARTLSGLGEYDAALRTALRALELQPRDEHALELAAAIAWRAGDRVKAQRLAWQLQEVAPDNTIAGRILRSTSSRTILESE